MDGEIGGSIWVPFTVKDLSEFGEEVANLAHTELGIPSSVTVNVVFGEADATVIAPLNSLTRFEPDTIATGAIPPEMTFEF